MSTVAFTIKNAKRLQQLFEQAPFTAAEEIRTAVTKSTLLMERESKKNKRMPVDTGRLRNSIKPTMRPLVGVVRALTDYAAFVHDGTRRMKARPFFREASEAAAPRIDDFFEKAAENITKSLT